MKMKIKTKNLPKEIFQRARIIYECLSKSYPEADTELKFSNHFELLIAVILSAQSTDVQVNKITGKLFKKAWAYPAV